MKSCGRIALESWNAGHFLRRQLCMLSEEISLFLLTKSAHLQIWKQRLMMHPKINGSFPQSISAKQKPRKCTRTYFQGRLYRQSREASKHNNPIYILAYKKQ